MSSILLNKNIRLIDINDFREFSLKIDKRDKKTNKRNISFESSTKSGSTVVTMPLDESIVYSTNKNFKKKLNKPSMLTKKNMSITIKHSTVSSNPSYSIEVNRTDNNNKKSSINLKFDLGSSQPVTTISRNEISNPKTAVYKKPNIEKKINKNLFSDFNVNNNNLNSNKILNHKSNKIDETNDIQERLNYLNSQNSSIQYPYTVYEGRLVPRFHDDQDVKNVQKYFLDKNSFFNVDNGYKPSFSFTGEGNKISWKGLRDLNVSEDTWNYSRKLFNEFQQLKSTNSLSPDFMLDYEKHNLKVNHYLVPNDSRELLLSKFKKLIPNLETRQLISTYANQSILAPAYIKLMTLAPEFFRYPPNKPMISYEVLPTYHGLSKLLVTNKIQLNFLNSKNEYKTLDLGVCASILLTKNRSPNIKYSYFVK